MAQDIYLYVQEKKMEIMKTFDFWFLVDLHYLESFERNLAIFLKKYFDSLSRVSLKFNT